MIMAFCGSDGPPAPARFALAESLALSLRSPRPLTFRHSSRCAPPTLSSAASPLSPCLKAPRIPLHPLQNLRKLLCHEALWPHILQRFARDDGVFKFLHLSLPKSRVQTKNLPQLAA